MLTKLRLSPSGPEVNLAFLLGSLFASGLAFQLAGFTAPSSNNGESSTAGGPGAGFRTTEDDQEVFILVTFDMASAAATPEIEQARVLVDGNVVTDPLGGATFSLVPVAQNVKQTFQVMLRTVIATAGEHTVGLRISAGAGGNATVTGLLNAGADYEIDVYGADPITA